MNLEIYIPEDFAANTYVLFDETRMLCIDPAHPHALAKRKNQKLFLLATHGHFDHILYADEWAVKYETFLYVHPLDREMVRDPALNLSVYFTRPLAYHQGLMSLESHSLADWGGEVWHLPGHSPGSVGVFFPEKKWFFGGDLLFAFSVGRTDLPGGDEQKLWESVEKVLSLPDDTIVYPGHGESFTIGDFRGRYLRWRNL
ncbi:MBL fold metallo-hydrolase [Thermospira aquatica]|uniref:MBL fold metallo-hydrolase n=1 Tax=Thermospira aquatica TaxID=2828656 RepID=A0AAX3BEM9_9SPIR|nr:MBL fold metallo-hydrolase [Thermospira aquatica]URA10686.1 MBL fold metallo-hydrolase [Thermospira aquatica]